MKFYLVKHGGPNANGNIDGTIKSLINHLDLSKTLILSSPDEMASNTAEIIRDKLKLKKKKVKRQKELRVIERYHGSKDHQLMSFLICFAADHYDDPDCEDIIVISHQELIRKTLNAFCNTYVVNGLEYNTVIERGSVHFVDTRKEEISKIF